MESIDSHNTPNLFTFSVDKVDVCQETPLLSTAERIIREHLGIKGKFEDFSHRNINEPRYLLDKIPGLFLTVHTSYHFHYHLQLSVSDFIVLIAQGLGRHINKHAEKLRKHFVDHEGQEIISITRNEFVKGQQNDWSTVFGEFADEIKKRVKTDIYKVIIDDTSVATPMTKIVSEITLMDAMKSYFKYSCKSHCGIPSITLEGTPEDWAKLQKKVLSLVSLNKDDCFELNWWLGSLIPVVEKICQTGIERKADSEFWSQIYKQSEGSGGPYITGWITTFFPYLANDQVFYPDASITTKEVPKQVCEVPFTWEYLGEEIPMKLYAGFLGAEFNSQTLTVKPAHFWSLVYQDIEK